MEYKTIDKIIKDANNIIDARIKFIKIRRLVKQSFLVDNYEMEKMTSEMLKDKTFSKQGFYTEILSNPNLDID